MKTLIVYYTRTGTTRIVAEALKAKLGDLADIEELIDNKNRSGVKGYMLSGRDAVKKTKADIREHKYDPAKYDLIILGTPVWVGLCAPAIRTYIDKHKGYFKQVAVYSTQGGGKEQRVFGDLIGQLGNEPVAKEFFTTKAVRQNSYEEKLNNFIYKLKLPRENN